MIYINILNIISFTYIFLLLFKYLLTIFQQDHYDINKFMKRSFKLYYHQKLLIILYIMIIIYILFFLYNIIINLLICLFFIVKHPKYIVSLNITKRIIRLIITYILIITTLILIIPNKNLLIFIFINLLMPYILLLSNIINYPIERYINNKYIKKAKLKLNSNKKLIKIAITGSYGKTSTKNILNHILENNTLTIATPKSFNTMLGITKTINLMLKSNTEIFICEMGTNHLNEISKMTEFINPDIACITDIGPQHLETFKTIDNVVKAKFEILNFMDYNKTAILNGDNSFIKSKEIISIKNINYVGINSDNDIYVKDIKVSFDLMEFTIIDENNELNIKTHLIGIHNINNILIVYGVIKALRKYNIYISNEEFISKIYTLSSSPHRLEYKKIDNYNIYDDSYNANIKGFYNAVNVIKHLNTKKIIITPGIVDTGKSSEKINSLAATYLLNIFDDIYLIKNKMIKYYQKVLEENNEHYLIFNSFKEAFTYFKIKYKNEEVSLLIENDLPDNFLER